VPAGASAQVVEPVSVSKSVSVPAGATRSLTLSCPGSAVALNGAPTSLRSASSVPVTDPREWSFRFSAGAAARTAGAVLRCVQLDLPSDVRAVKIGIGTRWVPLTVAPISTERAELTCKRGQVPTGWGLERPDSAADALAVATAAPTRRGFVFRIENTGAVEAPGTLRIRCLGRAQDGGNGERHSFSTRVATFAGGTTHTCRRSEYSLSAGASIDPVGDAVLTRAYPTGSRGGRWSFTGAADAPPVTSLVCLSRTTRFR
jgi:hypothetical protein